MSKVVPGKCEVVITSPSPVACLIIRLMNVDFPTFVQPTTYTFCPLRYSSMASIASAIPLPLWALTNRTSTGCSPRAFASRFSQLITFFGFTDFGNKSALLAINRTGFFPTKR